MGHKKDEFIFAKISISLILDRCSTWKIGWKIFSPYTRTIAIGDEVRWRSTFVIPLCSRLINYRHTLAFDLGLANRWISSQTISVGLLRFHRIRSHIRRGCRRKGANVLIRCRVAWRSMRMNSSGKSASLSRTRYFDRVADFFSSMIGHNDRSTSIDPR